MAFHSFIPKTYYRALASFDPVLSSFGARNRAYGWSRTALAPNVLDPEFVARSVTSAGPEFARWLVDTDDGVARLVDPADTAIGNFTVPIAPMVGCFGVALFHW